MIVKYLNCNGLGFINNNDCEKCLGTGYVSEVIKKKKYIHKPLKAVDQEDNYKK